MKELCRTSGEIPHLCVSVVEGFANADPTPVSPKPSTYYALHSTRRDRATWKSSSNTEQHLRNTGNLLWRTHPALAACTTAFPKMTGLTIMVQNLFGSIKTR